VGRASRVAVGRSRARAVFSSLNERDRVVFSRVPGFSPDRVIIWFVQAR
jgi:hypothetical protein